MSLAVVRPSVSDKTPTSLDELLQKMRQEIMPVLQKLRESYNSTSTGLVMSGVGPPGAAPTTDRAIYIDLSGGVNTTFYVWEGAAWAAK